jgi:eukaryotic-like serine/threonine-protein kinase
MEESGSGEEVRGRAAANGEAPGTAARKAGEAVQTPPPDTKSNPPPAYDSDAATIVDAGPLFDSPTIIELPHPSEAPTIMHSPSAAALGREVSSPRFSSPGAAGATAFLLPAGSVLGNRYEILQLLGEGGMGAVYKARDGELEREIALKVIRPELASNPEILQRFKQELILARQVTDRNIIRIFDLGEADGIRFITMEYVEGTSLQQMLRERGKIPVQESVEIILQTLKGLRAAHREGVIHRDLKPGNIMRDKQGRILVMDFGLARSIESDGMTKTGAVLGTMEYMSPEQAMGSELDPRSDLFTVGLILFELLTGKMPFKAETAIASLLKRVQERAVSVSSMDNAIPTPVADIVAKCLERDPNARYQNAEAMIEDLERFQGGGAAATLHFPPVHTWGRDIPWHWIGGIAAALVLAIVGFLLRGKLTGPSAKPGATAPVISLAVVPFRNASGDPSLDWLGASVAEMLTTDIGQSAQLHVVSSDHMHQLLRDLKITAETPLDDATVRRVAEFSNADQLVWGQYVRFGDEIRLDATVQDLKQQRTVPLKESSNQKDLLAAVDRLAQGIRSNVAASDSLVKELKAQAFKPSTKSLEAIRAYDEGLELARDGNNLDAIKKFEAATKEDPDFALGYAKLGETYAKLGYGDQADDASRKAVDLAQQLPAQERYRVLAMQARVSNDNKKAIEYYENLAKAAPGDSSIQLALAELEKNVGAYDTARDYLVKLLEHEPNYPEALVAIAEVEGERRNPQGALDYLNRALTLAIQLDNDELRSRVMYETGHTYRLLNKPDEALRNYQDSLAIRRRLGQKAGIAQTLAEIAEIQNVQGKPAQAIASYKEAVQLQREIGDKPHLSHSLLNLGAIYSDRGQYEGALKFYKESLQMQRDLHDQNYEAMCLSNIGNVYFFTARYDDALTYYQQALPCCSTWAIPHRAWGRKMMR